jgi:hypothetical protein
MNIRNTIRHIAVEGGLRKEETANREKREKTKKRRTNTDKETYISKKDEDKARITIDIERGKKDSKKKKGKENRIYTFC